MKKVEQHVIKSSHAWFEECRKLTSDSKNLFNTIQYAQRQSFFYGHKVLMLAELNMRFKKHELYKLLPAKVSQLVLKQSQDAWLAYFLALEAYGKDSSKFTGKPKPPGYAEKFNLVKYNSQAISSKEFKKGVLSLSKTSIKIPLKSNIKPDDLCEIRIVPRTGCFVIEVVYEQANKTFKQNTNVSAAIDLGLDNLATVVFSSHKQPIVINGKPLKSANKFYNKHVARYKGLLKDNHRTSKRIQNIVRNRNNFVSSFLHQASRLLVQELTSLGVVKVSIGKNEQWKTRVNLGRKNNQSFVQIPHAKFIEILTYKLEQVGITVLLTEESYTSKASYLDWDIIPTYQKGQAKPKFSGRRISRSWYKAKGKKIIHADVNGAYNIGRKSNPEGFLRDMGCLVVHPRRITPAFKRVHAQPGVA